MSHRWTWTMKRIKIGIYWKRTEWFCIYSKRWPTLIWIPYQFVPCLKKYGTSSTVSNQILKRNWILCIGFAFIAPKNIYLHNKMKQVHCVDNDYFCADICWLCLLYLDLQYNSKEKKKFQSRKSKRYKNLYIWIKYYFQVLFV